MRDTYDLEIYLEPGEAVALNAGYLLTRVLDVVQNGDTAIAIHDMSPACHTPDVIEMPYRPPLYSSGDVVGDYSFDAPLSEGSFLLYEDMAIYSTCKNNTFNGMPLPDIWEAKCDGTYRLLARFGYEDFKYRLGRK